MLEIMKEDWEWYNQVWVKYLIPNVAFFSWVVVRNKILTPRKLKEERILNTQ